MPLRVGVKGRGKSLPSKLKKKKKSSLQYRAKKKGQNLCIDGHVSSASIPTIAGFEQNDPEQTTGKPKHQLAIHLVMDSF